MRKLSKKISMLMVLAMLVSLFSGVVSASAASSWSFYNKTTGEIVEVKEAIEMESNQFADFDLYKDGKAFDTDVYTVKYESSDADVVWVDAKNGKLRADKFETAEAGDKAVISAKIENKNTGAKTTKSFTIVIAEEEVVVEPEEETYTLTATVGGAVLGAEALVADKDYALAATVVNGDGEAVEATIAYTVAGAAVTKLNLKAGEYTVVVTATLDGEVIATEKYDIVVEAEAPEVVAKKQTALNAVEITLNNADWAKKFAENIKLSYFAGEVEIAELVKATEVEGATVKVTLYNNMAEDVDYKFAFNGYDCAATIKGTKSTPASIKVVGGNVAAGTEGDLKVKFFTAEGVDITSQTLLDQVQYTGTDDNISVIAGQKIYFFEAGKVAVVNAVFDMGYDEEGNENADLKASGLYYSVAPFTDSNLNGYALAGDTAENAYLGWNNTVTLSLSDSKYLHAKYTRTAADGTPTQMNVFGGNDSVAKTTYTYYSTNETVLLVNPANGQLTPCSEGVASVYLKDANNVVKGSVTVNVKGYRGLTTFTASMSDRMVSASAAYNDTTTVNVSTKDQLGDYFDANWSVELVSPVVTGVSITDYFAWEEVTNDYGQTVGIKFTPNVTEITNADGKADIAADKTQVVTFKITAANGDGSVKKTWNGSATIKNVTGVTATSTVLEVSPATVDMKLNKSKVADYNATVKLVKKDAAGYDLGLEGYTLLTGDDTPSVATGAYSVIVLKNAQTTGEETGTLFNNAANTITFTPVTGTTTVSKTEKATYTIKVFKGNGTKAQLYATKTISFTDSTAAITVVVNNTNVNVNDGDALKAAMDFYRGSTKINDKVVSVAVAAQGGATAEVNHKVYVKKLTVTILNKEMNNDFTGNHTEDVVINQLFTIPQ